MEFLVEFEVNVPIGAPEDEVEDRENAEASAAAKLAEEGHLVRLWKLAAADGRAKAVGLFRAGSTAQLDGLLDALPLADWMHMTVTQLAPHPNDRVGGETTAERAPLSSRRAAPAGYWGQSHKPPIEQQQAMTDQLPGPRLSKVYRLEATLGQPLDLGDIVQGHHRRIVPQSGGRFTGPELNGELLPGSSADWQIVLPDGTALVDIRYTLQTDGGDLLYVQSRGVRHGTPEVLARLARGEDVNASEYTFRTSTQIETGAATLDWMNRSVFISVGGRQAAAVIYETYMVG